MLNGYTSADMDVVKVMMNEYWMHLCQAWLQVSIKPTVDDMKIEGFILLITSSIL